jgi:hypothetical protein
MSDWSQGILARLTPHVMASLPLPYLEDESKLQAVRGVMEVRRCCSAHVPCSHLRSRADAALLTSCARTLARAARDRLDA